MEEEQFEDDLVAAKTHPEFGKIMAEAKKRIPPGIKFGIDTIMLPLKIVEVYREQYKITAKI